MGQDEQYKVAEGLRSAAEVESNGWRRPTLLKMLRQACLTA
jgi:hypothetical protein